VGRAFLRLLIAKETELHRRYDVRWRLQTEPHAERRGSAHPDGLNPLALNGHWPAGTTALRTKCAQWLEQTKADVLFEQLAGCAHRPAARHIKTALALECSRISVNKDRLCSARVN